MDSVPSRVEDILLALINNSEYDGPIISRVEQILYSFLENSEYAAEPESRVEAILVALKATGLYDDAVISRIEKILYSKLNGTEYTAEPESRVEELLLEWALSEGKELTGVVPLLFNADGTPLLDYLISGNTVQNGTPTPDNPIMPQGTGERTGNLLDWSYFEDGYYLDNATGLPAIYTPSPSRIATTSPIDVSNFNNITFSFTAYATAPLYIYSLFNGNTLIRRVVNNNSGASIDTSEGDKLYLCIYSNSSNITTSNVTQAMLNRGTTALPYEPYGYKIPISSANATTPVYLGEAQTTRKIKKLVLTGEEKFPVPGTYPGGYLYMFKPPDIPGVKGANAVSTHYQQAYNNNEQNVYIQNGRIVIIDAAHSTSDDFKTYLAAQYAAGTPVTVWYVLATEETAVVNEPLMKIGNYADSISMEQAGVQIPTVNGSNTLDVLTTVKPSEVYIKYKGR